MKGKFYFVGTPIGNLKDFSINQIETLKSVDTILCEDKRTSRTLLEHYEIKNHTEAYHKFNYKEVIPKIVERLLSGENFALISDAGMPVISDPGAEIIEKLKENDIKYTAVGGVSAFLNAFVLSGMSYPFSFLGFLPEKKKDRDSFLMEFVNLNSTLIFYSSVHDIDKDIAYLYEKLGDRKICILRELTKLYEEITFSTLKEGYISTKKGEFVICCEGKKVEENDMTIEECVDYYLKIGYNKNEAIKLASKDKNMTKSEVYNYLVKKGE